MQGGKEMGSTRSVGFVVLKGAPVINGLSVKSRHSPNRVGFSKESSNVGGTGADEPSLPKDKRSLTSDNVCKHTGQQHHRQHRQ